MQTEQDHRPGRNDPCPCGSGQKFKRCCGLNRRNESVLELSLDEALDIAAGSQPPDYVFFDRWRDELTLANQAAIRGGAGSPSGLAYPAVVYAAQRLANLVAAMKAAPEHVTEKERTHLKLLLHAEARTARGDQFVNHVLDPPAADAPVDTLSPFALRHRLITALDDADERRVFETLGFMKATRDQHDPDEVLYFDALCCLRRGDWSNAIARADEINIDSIDFPNSRFVRLTALASLGDLDGVLSTLDDIGPDGMTGLFTGTLAALLAMNMEAHEAGLQIVAEFAPDSQAASDRFGSESAELLLPLAIRLVERFRLAEAWMDESDAADDAAPEASSASDRLRQMAARDETLSRLLIALSLVPTRWEFAPMSSADETGTMQPLEGPTSLLWLMLFDLEVGGTGIGAAGAALLCRSQKPLRRSYLEWAAAREEMGEAGALLLEFERVPGYFRDHPDFLPLLLGSAMRADRDLDVVEALVGEFLDVAGTDPVYLPPQWLPPRPQLLLKGALEALRQAESPGREWDDAGPASLGFFVALEVVLVEALLKPALATREWPPLDTSDWNTREKSWARLYTQMQAVASGERHGLTLGQMHILFSKVGRPGTGRDADSRSSVAGTLARSLSPNGQESLTDGRLAELVDPARVDHLRNSGAHGRLVEVSDARAARDFVMGALRTLEGWIATEE